MLTKEECEKALENIANLELQEYEGLYGRIKYVGDIRFCDYRLLRRLIEEHFSNPPLKFEELKEGMWIWDNNWNQYFEICEIYPKTKEFDVLIHQNRINKLRYEPMKFEENRFYRKQVKE